MSTLTSTFYDLEKNKGSAMAWRRFAEFRIDAGMIRWDREGLVAVGIVSTELGMLGMKHVLTNVAWALRGADVSRQNLLFAFMSCGVAAGGGPRRPPPRFRLGRLVAR